MTEVKKLQERVESARRANRPEVTLVIEPECLRPGPDRDLTKLFARAGWQIGILHNDAWKLRLRKRGKK